MSKIREKESLECVRMHIWASKTQKLPGPLSGPWTPAAECSLHSRDSASLCRQLSASEAGAPPLTKSWISTWVSAKNLQNNRLAHPLWELAHTKSWIRHCQRWYHTRDTFVTTTLQPTPHSLRQLSPLHNTTQHIHNARATDSSESVRVTHITAVLQLHQPGNYVKIWWNLKFKLIFCHHEAVQLNR